MQTRHKLNIDDLDVASFARPCFGERVSGDTVVIAHREEILFLAIIDALGHGPQANAVAVRAEHFLRDGWNSDVLDTMHRLHSELKGTIGAAAGLCVVDCATRDVRYTGVGNTVFRIIGSRATRLLSTDGIVGGHFRKPALQSARLNESDIVLLYTDGVSDRFDVEHYPQIVYHRAAAIVRKIVDCFGKPHDDATCIAMRNGR
jgi:serine phosphatase RsbU (regulator of sigma subunit)